MTNYEQTSDERKSPKGILTNVRNSVLVVLGLLFLLWIFKIVFAKPEYRYQQVCYMPYIVGEFFYVSVWGFINIDEPYSAYTGRVMRANNTKQTCEAYMFKVDWLRFKVPFINQ